MSDTLTQYDLAAGRALTSLVGRKDLLNKIVQTIQAAGRKPQIIFLIGEGGIGKTRLIYAITEALASDQRYTLAHQEIDCYDQDAHSKQRLAARIAEVLPERVSFAHYRDALRELQIAEQRGEQKVSELRREVEKACVVDLQAEAERRRIVLLIDTAERLVYVPTDTKSRSLIANSWEWVSSDLLNIPNITWVIAGREKSELLLEGITYKRFVIPDFDEAGARAYFQAIIEREEKDKNDEVVRRLRTALNPKIFSRVYMQTEGRPLRLALLADLLTLSNLESDSLEASEQDILTFLMSTEGIGAIVRALGRLRHGADQDLLATVLGRVEGLSLERVNRLLRQVAKLSFVKKPRGDRYFLHDIMYELLDRYEFSQPRERIQGARMYRAAIEFYKQREREQRGMLDQIFAPIESGHGRVGRGRLDRDALAIALQGRRQVLLDRLYYELCADPVNGFRFYLRYTFDAIFGGDPTFDVLLQAEMLNFLNELAARGEQDRYDLSPNLVQGIAIIRPVARAFSEANFGKANEEAERIRRDYQDNFPDSQRTSAMLNIWQAAALTEIAGKENLRRAETMLQAAIEHLEVNLSQVNTPSPGSAQMERTHVGLAFGYGVLGDYYRQIDLQHEAEQAYTKAVKLGREVRVLVNLATSLNRLGLVLSRLGLLQDAEALVEEGLTLRRDIGLRAAIAGAGSSLGIVLTNQGAYPSAIARLEVALDIYEALGNTLGITQTRCNLAEAERRYGGTSELTTIEERLVHLSAARQHAEEAVQQAKTLKSARTYARALIEYGCALRDLARITQEHNLRQFPIHRLIADSRAAFQEVTEVAGDSLPWMKLDALTNLAYLYYYVGDNNQAQKELEGALSTVPQEYLLIPSRGQPQITEETAQATFWLHIAKLHTLQGHIAHNRFAESRQSSNREGSDNLSTEEMNLLATCAEAYTLAMEYNDRYSNNLPGIQRSQHQIYDRLRALKVPELRVFGKQVELTESKYGLKESTLRRMLTRRTLWFG